MHLTLLLIQFQFFEWTGSGKLLQDRAGPRQAIHQRSNVECYLLGCGVVMSNLLQHTNNKQE